MKLDEDFGAIVALTLAYLAETSDEESKFIVKDLVLKYNILDFMENHPASEMSQLQLTKFIEEAIIRVQDKIEEYNALERED